MKEEKNHLDFGHFTETTDSRTDGDGSCGRHLPGTTGHNLLAALALPDTDSSALDSVLKYKKKKELVNINATDLCLMALFSERSMYFMAAAVGDRSKT